MEKQNYQVGSKVVRLSFNNLDDRYFEVLSINVAEDFVTIGFDGVMLGAGCIDDFALCEKVDKNS